MERHGAQFFRKTPALRKSLLCRFICLVSVLAMGAGCREPLPIPRIEPELHSWEQPYVGLDGLVVHVFNTGTLHAPAAAVFAGGSWTEIEDMEILAFVIERPDAGLVVFDTGFSARIREEPEAYLGPVLARLDVLEMAEGQDLPTQMRAAGMDPDAVSHVVVSHLHFDHTGALEAFENASVVISTRERDPAAHAGLMGMGFVEEDYDDVADWREVRYEDADPYATFVAGVELTEDGSLVTVGLEGHTSGSQGLVVRAAGAPILLTGDAAWIEKSWHYAARPAVAYDMRLWWEQIWRIKKFAQLEPSLVVIPGHDLAALNRIEHPAIRRH